MKSVLLIGLGRFGKYIAMKLDELHHEVLAVDSVESRVNDVLPYVTSAQIGDSTNQEFLASLGVRNFDVCIVAIGDDFQSSLETTSLLKELGAKLVVSRAARDVHAKFLLRLSILRSRWHSGRPCDTVQIIFSTTSNSMKNTPSWKFPYLPAGSERRWAISMSGRNTVSISWL